MNAIHFMMKINKMSSNENFCSVFDYRSVFDYNSKNIISKKMYKSVFTYSSISGQCAENVYDYSLKESWPSFFLRNAIVAVLYLFVILLFPFSLWLCIKRVQALERVVLFRFGHMLPIREPGFIVVIPCVDVWTRVDLRPNMFTLSTPQILTADGGIVEVKADVEFQVLNVVNYTIKLQDGENALKNIALYCLKNIISEKDLEDVDFKRELISMYFKEELNSSAIKWGLEIINVYLHSIKVIKPAESVNAVSTVMAALKAATDQFSQSSTVAPLIPFMHVNNINFSKAEECKTVQNSEEMEEHFFTTYLKRLTEEFNSDKLQNLTAKYKFVVSGTKNHNTYCFIEKGKINVFEDMQPYDCDVTLTLTEDILKDLSCGDISPAKVLMNHNAEVAGDWNLLLPFLK